MPTENHMQNPRDTGALPGILGLGQSTAVNIYNAFFLFSFLTPIIFALAADLWLGRFKTLMVGLGQVPAPSQSLQVDADCKSPACTSLDASYSPRRPFRQPSTEGPVLGAWPPPSSPSDWAPAPSRQPSSLCWATSMLSASHKLKNEGTERRSSWTAR